MNCWLDVGWLSKPWSIAELTSLGGQKKSARQLSSLFTYNMCLESFVQPFEAMYVLLLYVFDYFYAGVVPISVIH